MNMVPHSSAEEDQRALSPKGFWHIGNCVQVVVVVERNLSFRSLDNSKYSKVISYSVHCPAINVFLPEIFCV